MIVVFLLLVSVFSCQGFHLAAPRASPAYRLSPHRYRSAAPTIYLASSNEDGGGNNNNNVTDDWNNGDGGGDSGSNPDKENVSTFLCETEKSYLASRRRGDIARIW